MCLKQHQVRVYLSFLLFQAILIVRLDHGIDPLFLLLLHITNYLLARLDQLVCLREPFDFEMLIVSCELGLLRIIGHQALARIMTF
jgi:hypothetical protein